MNLKGCVLMFFCVCSVLVKGQTTDDRRNLNGVFVYDLFDVSTDTTNPNTPAYFKTKYPFIKGGMAGLKWMDLETAPDVYDWQYFDQMLFSYTSQGMYVGLLLWTGPDCPSWIFNSPYNVEQVVTTLSQPFPYYPNYMNPVYKNRLFLMIDSVAAHTMSLPASIRDNFIFYQSCEGTTGDETLFKGTPLNASFIPSPTWITNFKHDIWLHLDSLYEPAVPKIHLLVNPDDTITEVSWFAANIPNTWIKTSKAGHVYQVNDEVFLNALHDSVINITTSYDSTTIVRCRDEYDVHAQPVYTKNPQWHTYWTALSALHFGLDIWPMNAHVLDTVSSTDGAVLFSQMAGYKNPKFSPRAFCALRDGLVANDTLRFPVLQFGVGNSTNNVAGRNRAIAIANAFSSYGASQDDPVHGQGSFAFSANADALNDVGWDIFPGNYERYLTQYSPNTTSIGYWRQGDTTQVYGRFARGFNHNAAMDTMFFNINDQFFDSFPNNAGQTILLKIVYLDKGVGSWKVMYDAVDSLGHISKKTALTHTNTNSTNTYVVTNPFRNQNFIWKADSVLLSDGYFGNTCPHGTDIMLVNADSTDKMFHSIEIIKTPSPSQPSSFSENQQKESKKEFDIFPNPVSDILTIDHDFGGERKCSIRIINLCGQTLYNEDKILYSRRNIISMYSLPDGIYFLILETQTNIYTFRVVKATSIVK